MEKRWSGSKPLPSDVVEDSDFDSVLENRIPTFGLPHLPGNHAWGKQQQDSRCDSGVFDSFQSGASSVRSSYADGGTTLDSVDETCLGDRLKSLSIAQQTSERLPSVDEGFFSTDLKDESISWNKPSNPKIVFPRDEKEPETRVEHPREQYEDSGDHIDDPDHIDDRILDIFLSDEDGDTKLHMAIIQIAKDVALKMIELCPDSSCLAIQNDLGQAPLHLAVLTKQADIVRNLVIMGAPLEQRDRHGNTPLHLACREGDLTCVQALTLPLTTAEIARLTYSVTVQCIPQNMDLWNYEGETCLHVALLKGHNMIAAYLISPHVQANINVKDGRSGRTVLHYAVESGNLDAVRFVAINCQANVNATTFDGSTPLKLAVGRGFHTAANLLVQAGADRSVLNSDEDSDSSESEDESGGDDEMIDDIHIGGKPIAT